LNEENNYLNLVIDRLCSKYKIIAIILIGSRARGDWKPWSDYDLLILGNFDKNYLDRILEILGIIEDIPIDIEPHPYTLDEAIKMLRRGNLMIFDSLEEGKILFKTSGLEKLYNMYKELKKRGMRKTETSIIIPD